MHSKIYRQGTPKGAYAIFLVVSYNNDSIGGYAHLLEFNSRKSRRVVKSTWGAEMHALISGLERAERIYYWLMEIWQGFDHVPKGVHRVSTTLNAKQHIAFQACIDCKGLYDSIVSPVVGSLTDMSMQLYLISLRESIRLGPLSELCWIETSDMIVDSQTKFMEDVLWTNFFQTAYWAPTTAQCTRRTDKGVLEKFSQALLALRNFFVDANQYDYRGVETDLVNMLGYVTKSQVLFYDFFR